MRTPSVKAIDGRAVPRLHQAGVVLVEGPLLLAHRLVAGPRLGDHHHHRVRQRAAGEHQQLEHVVEHRRVAALGVDDGQDLREVVAEQRRREQALARVHPVDVAAQGVDLAVVADEAVRVRARPVREGVGARSASAPWPGRLDARVDDVREVGRQLGRDQHPLVDERAVREARHVEDAPARDVGRAHRVLDAPAQHVQLPLEGEVLLQRLGPAEEHLPHHRLAGAGGGAERGVVGRHRRASRGSARPPRRPSARRSPRSGGGRRGRWAGTRGRRRSGRARAARRPASPHSSARKPCGICIRMPAPSPVFFSQPQAPRCSRFSSTWTACSTMSWDLRPWTSTTKPMPHASCSWRGS